MSLLRACTYGRGSRAGYIDREECPGEVTLHTVLLEPIYCVESGAGAFFFNCKVVFVKEKRSKCSLGELEKCFATVG